ncbi:MAG: NAD(P)-binding protein [Candidatus Caldarchaeales archaeon]
MSGFDVLVIGSDLTASALAHLLSSRGFKVLVLERGLRLGGPHPYLPVLEGTVRSARLPIEGSLGRFVRVRLQVRLGERTLVHGSGERIAPLDMRRASEALLSEGAEVLFNARHKLERTPEGEVAFSVDSIDGKLEGRAASVVRSVPLSPVRLGEVEVVCGGELLEGSLRLSGSGISAAVPLTERSHLHLGTHGSGQTTIARSALSTDSFRGDLVSLPVGEAAGELMPPWTGDYAIESALVASRVVEVSVSGDEAAATEELLEHRMRSEMRARVIGRIAGGGTLELDVDQLMEALSPASIQL